MNSKEKHCHKDGITLTVAKVYGGGTIAPVFYIDIEIPNEDVENTITEKAERDRFDVMYTTDLEVARDCFKNKSELYENFVSSMLTDYRKNLSY